MLEKSLSFLSLLKENNDKEWFHANKAQYDEAKLEFEVFTQVLIDEVKKIDPSVGNAQPKDCIFRIFRDVRFSNDKTPYKTNFGAYVARGGNRKSEYAGYYFHLDPAASMLAGGIWMPQPDVLKAVRNEIFHNTEAFVEMINVPAFKKHFDEFDREYVLKTAPKDFPKDFAYVDLLKLKSFTMSKALDIEIVTGNKLLDEVRAVFGAMVPTNNLFNGLIDDLRNP